MSRWIGHSITISGRHYANSVPDELFAKAAGIGEIDRSDVPTSAQRQAQRAVRGAQKRAMTRLLMKNSTD